MLIDFNIPADWEVKRICDVAKVILSNVDKISSDDELPVRLCNYTDVYYNKYIDSSLHFSQGSANINEISRFCLKAGDVLITKDSEDRHDIAVPAIVLEDMQNVLCGYHLAIVRPNDGLLCGGYLAELLQHHRIQYYFACLANGVTRFGLTSDSIEHARIPIPPLSEQTRIAEIARTYNQAITKIEMLIGKNQQLKKGLMQQLLTGKRRFREFVKSRKSIDTRFGPIPEDWPLIKVGQFAKECSQRAGNGNSINVLSCTKYDGLVDSIKYFGKRIYSEDTSNYKLVKKGQFAYATNHIEEGSIGLLTHLEQGLVSPMYTVFETDKRIYTPFLYALFKTELYRHIFEVNTNSSVDRRGSLRWNQFAQLPVALPDHTEQERIASVLAACDREISLLQAQAEALKKQKRGLMQKLLTGRIRVKEINHSS